MRSSNKHTNYINIHCMIQQTLLKCGLQKQFCQNEIRPPTYKIDHISLNPHPVVKKKLTHVEMWGPRGPRRQF